MRSNIKQQPLVWILLASISSTAQMPSQGADGVDTVNWYQWRGQQRDAQFHGTAWCDSLSEGHLALNWRVELGPSYSGPIVAADRVFVTETVDEKREVVRALERSTGKELWRCEWEGAMRVPFFAASNGSWIRATPAFDGERLYVAGMRDRLVCLDAASGSKVWDIDFVQQLGTPLPDFGFASSPLLDGDFLYVQAAAGLVKLEKGTGKIIWQALQDGGGMWGSAFSSPVMTTLHDTRQLIVQTRTKLAGVESATGDVLWEQEIPAFRGMNILTPTVIGNGIFTSSYGGRSLFLAVDKRADGWHVSESWTHKSQGYMSSPVVIDQHIYLHLRNQRFVCLDSRSGEERWTTKPFGKYWSLIANGDRILALDQRGELLLIKAAADQFNLLDRRKIGDDSWAHLVVCGSASGGHEVFVRELNAMAVYRWQ